MKMILSAILKMVIVKMLKNIVKIYIYISILQSNGLKLILNEKKIEIIVLRS